MKSAIAVAMSAAVLTSLLSAAPARAERFDDRGGRPLTIDRGRPYVAGPAAGRPVDSRSHAPRPFTGQPSGPPHQSLSPHHFPPQHGHGFAGRGFRGHGSGGQGFVGSGPVVFYSPGYAVDGGGPVYAEPQPYDFSPAYAGPQATSVALAPAPPLPTVIEHATGRYELRGDGLTVPYTWVWVPNPPAAPPATATPAPKPAGSAAAETSPSPRSSLYTWTDREGVVHWTDNAGSVPEEYRIKVKKRSL